MYICAYKGILSGFKNNYIGPLRLESLRIKAPISELYIQTITALKQGTQLLDYWNYIFIK